MKTEHFQKFPVYPGKPLTKTLLVMKLTVFLIFLGCLQASAGVYSQTVSLSENGTPLIVIFKKIEKQTGYSFVYNTAWMAQAIPVTISVKDVPIKDALDLCFKNQPLSYLIVENIIVVKGKELKANEISAIVTIPRISGKVLNEKGEPLAGASVYIKNGSRGTSTNGKGIFELTNIPMDAVIEISYSGYETRQIRIHDETPLSLTLSISNSALDQIQVIAYGTTTKRLNTGNITTVKAEQIERQPVSNPLAALEGQVPGLFIVQNSGMPGGNFSVQIRGQNSIANGNDPFYVIDGVPYTSQLLASSGSGIIGGGNPLNYLNISDIESIEVLKDADATAIYGSRGANGVILITTKKGKSGKSKLDLNYYSGVGKVSRKMNLLDLKQYLEMRHEAFTNDGAIPGTYDFDVNGTWDSTRSTDWQKTIVGKPAKYINAQVGLSGGNDNYQYQIGGGYHKEGTVLPGDFNDQKASLHFNISNLSFNKKLKVNLSGSYLSDKNNLPSNDPSGYTSTWLSPDSPPLYNSDGSLNWSNSTWQNPIASLSAKFKAQTTNLISNAVISYELISGLEIKASLGYTNMQINETQTYPTTIYAPAAFVTQGSALFTNNNIRSWIIEPQVTYHRNVLKGNFTFLLGTSIQYNSFNGQILEGDGYSSDELLESLAGASTISKISNKNTEYKYNALFSRINYNWQDRYLFNLTVRRDGSSRFGPGKQFSNFGSAGIGWIFSNENFLRNHTFLSFGKLRASYGSTGNDQIGDYKYLSTYNFTGNIPYQGVTGLIPNNLANSDFAWEVNKKAELGLEIGLFKDRILVTSSYYRNRSSNQLIPYALPDITGFNNITANLPATVQNTGLEFGLNTTNFKNKDFSWTTSINLTIPNNKLIKFPLIQNTIYANTLVIGQPLAITKVFRLKGVNDTSGLYEFYDFKNNATYYPTYSQDNTKIMNLAPKFYGSFQNSFQYMGFGMDIFFQFVKQTGTNYLTQSNFPPGLYPYYNQPALVEDRWQKPGDIKPIERFTQGFGDAYDAYKNAQLSDFAYSDASFIRLKNVTFSYRLSNTGLKKLNFSSCRIYVSGQNLLTITKFKGADPENQDINILPPLRVISGGIQLSL